MNNVDCQVQETYEEARKIGVYRDWYSIVLTRLKDEVNHIAIKLLENGLSIEDVYTIAGLSEEEYKLRKSDWWNRICAVIDDKNSDLGMSFSAIIHERIFEITKQLLRKRMYLNIALDAVGSITGVSQKQIDRIINELRNER